MKCKLRKSMTSLCLAYKLNTFVLHRKEPIHIVTTKEKFFWNSQLEIHSIAILAWSISLGLLICTPTTDLRNRETLEKFQVLETLDKIWIKRYGWACFNFVFIGIKWFPVLKRSDILGLTVSVWTRKKGGHAINMHSRLMLFF